MMDMMRVRLVVYCFLLLFLGACSSGGNMKAQYFSTLMPLYDFDTNAPTIIKSDPWDLVSNYYASVALLSFKQRGFSNIYLGGQINDSYARNVIYVKVMKSKLDPNNYKYSFTAQGTCNVIGGVPHCTIDSRTNQTDKKDKVVSVDVYQVAFDWYDAYKQRRVLYVGGMLQVSNNKLNDGNVYPSLISQTVSRIDFKKPSYYMYHYQANAK